MVDRVMGWLRRRHATGERGAVAVFAAVAALGLIVAVGLVVDGGGKVRALQQAEAVAGEAARQAGQAVQVSDVIAGQPGAYRVDPARARSAALSYVDASGMTGTAQVVGGQRIQVTATTGYDPVFLTLIGIGRQTVTGSAEARLVRTLDGTER